MFWGESFDKETAFVASNLLKTPDDWNLAIPRGTDQIGPYLTITGAARLLLIAKERRELDNKFFQNPANMTSHSLANKKLNRFITAFKASVQAKNGLVSISDILLTFIWKKAESLKDLISYFRILAEEGNVLSAEGRQMLKDEGKVAAWVNSRFTKEDFTNILSSGNTLVDMDMDMDKVMALGNGNLMFVMYAPWERTLPPIFSYGTAVVVTPTGHQISFPDCVEATIRNLIGWFALENGRFSADLLRSRYPAIDRSILDFFTRYFDPDLHNTQEARNEWTQLLTNIPGMKTILYAKAKMIVTSIMKLTHRSLISLMF